MASPLDLPGHKQPEQALLVDGVPVPISRAASVVSRFVVAIIEVDKLVKQGFASEAELQTIQAILKGDDDASVTD
jgi:hypothetical protein